MVQKTVSVEVFTIGEYRNCDFVRDTVEMRELVVKVVLDGKELIGT